VGFIASDEVPVGIRELRLDILIATQLIQADGHWVLREPIAGARRFQLVVRQNLEGKLKSLIEFVLSLLREISRAHDHAAVQVTADQQFFDEQTSRDCFAGAGIIGQKGPQRSTGSISP
jgi:hypothetical protein